MSQLDACLHRPPIGFSRKPVIVLSGPSRQDKESKQFEDALDRHVDDVLQRPSRVRRTLMGVWSFLKTRTHVHRLDPSELVSDCFPFLAMGVGPALTEKLYSKL